MKILYVLPYVPSPIRVRPYQIIRSLVSAGHQVTVVALADEFATADTITELQTICEAVHIIPHKKLQGTLQAALALPSPTPLWAAYCFSGTMERKLQELAASGQFDVAHVEHLRAAHFASALAPLPTVFDAVDCITALRKQMLDAGGSLSARLLSWEEWSKLRTYEPQAYRAFPQIAVTSAHDKSELQQLDNGLPPITVIPNGVDCDYFHPDESIVPDPDTLVFSGKMSYHANNDAALFLLTEVLPRLRRLRSGVKVLLVGSKPSDSLKSLAAQIENVTVTGFVEDIRPFLWQATLAVCPMRIGVGIQNKALEAMAVGRPVVCSPLAARALTEAVETQSGVQVGETADEFAQICAELLAAPSVKTASLGNAARAYVETRHQWSIAAQDFSRLYEKVITDSKANTAQ